ncbi:MAG: FxsA family protein [Devosia sp.]|uniref:FxsA family protein n=1 Tax=Devosia sp. TaxID=1871048 RepID=UPI00339285AB
MTRLLRFIPLLLLALPLIEIALFILVGRAIGVLPTLGLVILAVVVGGFVLRQQGLGVLNRMRTNMQTGTLPGQTLFDGMLLALAAVLLIIPGFLGDFVAILLLLPPVRAWLYKTLTRNITVVQTTTSYRSASPSDATPPHINGPGTIDLDDDDWQRK